MSGRVFFRCWPTSLLPHQLSFTPALRLRLITASKPFHITARSQQFPPTPIPKIPAEPAPDSAPSPGVPHGGIIDTMAQKLRQLAPDTTETYQAYGAGKELYLECARQAAYVLPITEDAKKTAVAKGKQKEVAIGVEEELQKTGEVAELSRSAKFWYEECDRPKTFNSWAQVTILHMWTIMVRFRAFLDEDKVRIWQQHFVDHFFFDAEEKMEFQYGIKSGPTRSKYLKDLYVQYRGMVAAYDEALARHAAEFSAWETTSSTNYLGSDNPDVPAAKGPMEAILAAAIWRNLWDARDDVDLVKLAMVTAYILRIVSGLEKMPDAMVQAARLAFGDVRKEEGVVLPGKGTE